MTSIRLQRVRNLGAWVAGAILTQTCIITVMSFLHPDPAYGVSGTLFVAGLFNVIGTLCGLLGYALAAAALPSSATGAASFAAGALWVSAVIALIYTTPLLPAIAQLPAAAFLCIALAAASYFVVNRTRSNNRSRGP
jgi:hypothetical protein